MSLKMKFESESEIPVEHRALYVERDGSWVLDVLEEQADAGHRPGATVVDATAKGWRVPLPVEVPREKRTLRQFAGAAEENQKLIGLESEVRRLEGAESKSHGNEQVGAVGAVRVAGGQG